MASADNKHQKQLEENRRKAGYKCHYRSITGSRIKQKVCTTSAMRDASREKAREFYDSVNGAGNGAPRPPNGP